MTCPSRLFYEAEGPPSGGQASVKMGRRLDGGSRRPTFENQSEFVRKEATSFFLFILLRQEKRDKEKNCSAAEEPPHETERIFWTRELVGHGRFFCRHS